MTKPRAIWVFAIALAVGLGLSAIGLWSEFKVSASDLPAVLSVQNSQLKVEYDGEVTVITLISYDNQGKLLDCQSKAPKIKSVELNLAGGFGTLDEKPKTNFISGDCQSSWQFELQKIISAGEITTTVVDAQNQQFTVSAD